MKTLGQMLMDAYAKADTIDTVALVGDRLVITHKPNANEQIEAAFTEELKLFLLERISGGTLDSALMASMRESAESTPDELRFIRIYACRTVQITLGVPTSKEQ